MTYIYAKKINGKVYYYLRRSVRNKSKTLSKDICYLGKNLASVSINELKRKYPNEIKNYRKIRQLIENENYSKNMEHQKIAENLFLDKEQLTEINTILLNYKCNFKKLDIETKRKILDKFKMKFIMESTSIESIEKISLEEITKILKEGIVPKNKSILCIYKIVNTYKLLNLLEKEKPLLNLRLIEKIPNKIFENILGVEYRKINKRTSFVKSKINNIKPELKLLIDWFYKKRLEIHPLVLVILFHHKLKKIHPFTGLNGETERVLINYMLSLFDYPPIIIPKKSKKEYYKIMDKISPKINKNILTTNARIYKPLIDFMQKQFVRTYWNYFV